MSIKDFVDEEIENNIIEQIYQKNRHFKRLDKDMLEKLILLLKIHLIIIKYQKNDEYIYHLDIYNNFIKLEKEKLLSIKNQTYFLNFFDIIKLDDPLVVQKEKYHYLCGFLYYDKFNISHIFIEMLRLEEIQNAKLILKNF